MKLGRIEYQETEYYGQVASGRFYPIEVTRNNLGQESFLFGPLKSSADDSYFDLKEIDFKWLPPIARPGKILCVGRNYAEHSREQGKEPESSPLIFSKFVTSLIGHQAKVPYPTHTNNLDYEVELAVIIGKTARNLNEDDDPYDYIFGYTLANDLTARDIQKSEKQWTRGKGFDYSLPIGPTIITRESVPKPVNNEIWLTVNGDKRQLSNTSHMIFPIDYLIRYLSREITLEPGDILLTGTPEGVGYYMDPKQVLQAGDEISCGVVDIGELRFSIEKQDSQK